MMKKFSQLFNDFSEISLDAGHGELILIIDFAENLARLKRGSEKRDMDGDGFEIAWTSDMVLEVFVYELSKLHVAIKLLFTHYIKE